MIVPSALRDLLEETLLVLREHRAPVPRVLPERREELPPRARAADLVPCDRAQHVLVTYRLDVVALDGSQRQVRIDPVRLGRTPPEDAVPDASPRADFELGRIVDLAVHAPPQAVRGPCFVRHLGGAHGFDQPPRRSTPQGAGA